MRQLLLTAAFVLGFSSFCSAADDGFIPLFDGKSFDGWRVGANADSFRIEDGLLVANGPCAHLFYQGKVNDHDFTNFHFKAEVMTKPSANSGLYFHTKFQEKGWPSIGYEAQVNNTHRDPKKTGGLYNIRDVFKAPAEDNEWFTEEIIVKGKQIVIKVNGKTLVDYTEPEGVTGGRKLSSGTFAIQAHDPGSTVYYKNIVVKPLP